MRSLHVETRVCVAYMLGQKYVLPQRARNTQPSHGNLITHGDLLQTMLMIMFFC